MFAVALAGAILAADAEDGLRGLVVRAVAQGARPVAYVEVFGRRMRLTVESADEDALSGEVLGQELRLRWREFDEKELLRLARRCASMEDGEHVMLLLRFAAEKQPGEAEGLLDRLRALDPKAAGRMEKAVRPPPPAASSPLAAAKRAKPRASKPAALKRRKEISPSRPAGVWENIGPSAGGYMLYPGVSSHDPKLMFIACDMSGSYRSDDGGLSWRMFPVPESTFGVMRMYPAFHPVDSKTIYWGNDAALLVSRDAGLTWAVAHRNGKRGKERPPSALAFDHDNPSSVFLAHGQRPLWWLEGASSNELYRSRDGGNSWTRVNAFPSDGAVVGIHVDRTSPVGRRRVFAATTRGVFVSTDGGDTWGPSKEGLPSADLYAFAGVSEPGAKKVTLYASFRKKGVYVSADGTPSWRRAGLPEGEDYLDLAVSDVAHNIAYVSTFNMNDGVRIYRTSDAGVTWSPAQGGKNPDDPGWKYLQGPRASGRINSFAVCPSDPSLLIVTDRSAAIVGERSGAYWRQVYCDAAGPGLWRGRGLEVTSVMDIRFDPQDPRRVYACYNDQGLMISPTGGESWDTTTRGRTNNSEQLGYSCYAVALDPARTGVVYAGVSLPNDIYGRTDEDTAAFRGALVMSTDGGKSWRPLGRGRGLPQGPCTAILIDPESAPSRRRILAGIFGRGVYLSEDGGSSWRESSAGLDGSRNVFALRRAAGGTLWLCVLKGRRGAGGLYCSRDGGASWQRLGAGTLNNVFDVSMDPRNAQVLYAACGQNSGGTDGVFRSTDSGRSWKIIFEHRYTFSACAHPRVRGLLYACSRDWASGGVWRSVDDGRTWRKVEGIPFRPIHRVFADPVDERRLWVATHGGGIWRGVPRQ